MRIDALTPEQAARLPLIRDEWMRIGLSTQPADRARAENGARQAYRLAGLPAPSMFIWLGSPMAGAIASAMLAHVKVGAQVRAQVWDQVYRCGYGQHDANWLGFYAAFAEYGLAEAARLDGLSEIAQSSGWFWLFAGACILTERPSTLARDDQGRLHSESGMAIAYPDGWGIHAWHGVRVPAHVIEHPEIITAAQIKDEQNAEVRRVMLKRTGEERFVRESGAAAIHHDETGVLYDFGGETLAVKVLNSTPEPDGSVKTYWLYVNPELRPMLRNERGTVELGEPQKKTARNAVASTFGLTGDAYQPAVET